MMARRSSGSVMTNTKPVRFLWLEERQRDIVADRLEHDTQWHADLHALDRAVDDVGHQTQARLLDQFDQPDDVRYVLPREPLLMIDGVAVQAGTPADLRHIER